MLDVSAARLHCSCDAERIRWMGTDTYNSYLMIKEVEL